jgi:thymidylate synthase
MRSNDLYLGLPTNIMGYAFLNLAFSKLLNLQPGELTYFGWDAHLYNNQLEVVNQQITRDPRQLPSLIFKKDFSTLEELLGLNYEDLEIINYNPHPPLPKVEMAV